MNTPLIQRIAFVAYFLFIAWAIEDPWAIEEHDWASLDDNPCTIVAPCSTLTGYTFIWNTSKEPTHSCGPESTEGGCDWDGLICPHIRDKDGNIPECSE